MSEAEETKVEESQPEGKIVNIDVYVCALSFFIKIRVATSRPHQN